MRNPTTQELAVQREHLKAAVSLDNWDDFVAEGNFPVEILPALAARRPDMIRLARRRPLTADEADKLYKLIVKLFATNEALRAHALEVSRMVADWRTAMNILSERSYQIEDFTNFRVRREEDQY